MSDLAPTYPAATGHASWIALVLALASIVTWLVAATATVDELWLGAAFLGLVAALVAWGVRRAGARNARTLTALILGGLVAAQVIVFTSAWGLYHLVA